MKNYRQKYEQKVESIKSTQRIQESNGNNDLYNLGVRNGIELCLAILEEREPELIQFEQTKETETKEELKRVQFHGKRVKGE